ncbi:hypothetical protein CMI41_01070 [Candidatus Pacearchaeota archaeon]|nr:hypothetical protein [Candidatus Pacearchaeota archaeon]|tara:strand:- start:3457 stop:3717 length:261 start_codon:yes stop_codon:yes gene_type:complete
MSYPEKLLIIFVISTAFLLGCSIVYRVYNPIQKHNLVTDIEDDKKIYEFFAHDNTVKCVTWCVDVAKYRCFGQCLPVLIEKEDGHD